MSKVVVVSNLTLDGAMQAAGRPDEDLRGGFQHGGWALPYNDPVMGFPDGTPSSLPRAVVTSTRFWRSLDPDVVLRADHAAVQAGASKELRGAAAVANLRELDMALLDD